MPSSLRPFPAPALAAGIFFGAGLLWVLGAELLARRAEPDRGWFGVAADVVFVGLSAGVVFGLLRWQRRRFALAQAGLEAVARRYSTMMAASEDCIHVLDAEGRLVEANAAFYRSLGHDPARPPAGLHVSDWDAGWSPEELRGKVGGLLVRGLVFETVHRDLAGRRREVEISASRVEVEGRALLFCVARDLTERHREDLRQSREDRIEGLALLSGGIAHELNNALAPIVLGADLLRESHPGLGVDARLNSITGAARRGAEVVRRMLTFAEGLDGEREPVALDALLRALAAEVEAEGRPDLTVRLEIAPGTPMVLGDEAQLKTVLRGLVTNALEAMGPAGGGLTFGLRWRLIAPEKTGRRGGLRPGPHLECFVRDTGPGLTDEARRRLFSPFFTTKEIGMGPGLGLAMALGLVRGHGGVIEQVDPAEGGAEFRVVLPVAAQFEATGPAGAI